MTTNDKLKSLLISVQNVVKETKENVTTMAGDIKDLKLADEKFQNDLQDNRKTCQSLEEKNRRLKNKIENLEKRMEDILIRERYRNIILYNLDDSPTFNRDLKQSTLELLNGCNVLIREDQIEKITRLGKNEGSRPLLINFNDFNCKKLIFQNALTLKNKSIYFSHDYTPQQQTIRRELRKYKQILTEKGKVTFVKGTKLSIDGNLYDLRTIETSFDTLTSDKDADYKDGNESEGEHSSPSSSRVPTVGRKRGRNSKSIKDTLTPRTKKTRMQKHPTDFRDLSSDCFLEC